MKLSIFSKTLFIWIAIFLFTGCAYTPSAKFSRQVVGEKISTTVIVSELDPQNSVVVKDAINRAVIEVFQASISDKKNSDSHLILNMQTPSYTPIVYDKDGFVIGYRMKVTISFEQIKSGISKKRVTSGYYDFSVAPNAIVTDQSRFDAINFAAQRAIRSFVSQVSADGARAKR